MFTEEETTAAIEAVVAEVGEEFKYADRYGNLWSNRCMYRHTPDDFSNSDHKPEGISPDGEWACIVGRVLGRLGVDYSKVYENNAFHPGQPAWFLFPEHVGRALNLAQTCQDAGQPWGIALENYHDYLETNKK